VKPGPSQKGITVMELTPLNRTEAHTNMTNMKTDEKINNETNK